MLERFSIIITAGKTGKGVIIDNAFFLAIDIIKVSHNSA